MTFPRPDDVGAAGGAIAGRPHLNWTYTGTRGAQPLTARPMVLSDAMRIRGGRRSRRRRTRVWVEA